MRNSSGSWLTLITSTDIITINTWNYAAFTWSVSGTTLNVKLYLNDKVYSGSTTSFKDFTGAKTAIGGTVSGSNQLNGQLEGLTYYATALSSEEISQVYTSGRGNKVNYKYDAIGRVTDRTLSTGVIDFITKYSFETGKTVGSVVNTTTKVKEIDNNGNKIAYTYDPNGSIATITENGKVINYTYDQLNQLTREDNQVLNKTITYSYDAGGNILSKTEYAYTTGTLGAPTSTIGYGYTDTNWKDKLTSFNGKAITYDAIGNPLTYDGYTFTWEQGRQLQSLNGNGKNISYKYNVDGIRTEKTVNGVTTKYHLAGDIVTFEENGTDKVYYTYDSEDNLVSMNLNGVEYCYIRNAQGDIIGLFDKNGATVASYTYDSWGKLISIKDGSGTDITNNTASAGYKNPYRYRGYRYDTETGLYYLQSRYYNHEWGRFINEDEIATVTGELLSTNMFAYCINNPINMKDDTGFRPAFISEEEQEAYNDWAKQQDELYEDNATDRLRSRDAKRREKKNVDKALGKRGTKQREKSSEALHKGKKKSGKGNDDNFGWKDLKNQDFDKIEISIGTRIAIGAGGILLVGGTIAEDILTGGVGIADDGVTISGGIGLIVKAFGN